MLLTRSLCFFANTHYKHARAPLETESASNREISAAEDREAVQDCWSDASHSRKICASLRHPWSFVCSNTYYANTDGSRNKQLLVQDQLYNTMPSPALHPVQESYCWALPLSPLLFYAPELSNDLLSNYWWGKLLDHAGSCCPACRLRRLQHHCCIDILRAVGYHQLKQAESILVSATGVCNE